MTLDPTNEKKKTNKEYKKLINKIRYLIRSITKTSDDCDEKCELPLDKTLEINNMATVVRAVFHKENKYYLQVALDECLHKLWII